MKYWLAQMNYLFAEMNYSVAEMKYSGPEMIVRDAEVFSAFDAENFCFEEFCHRGHDFRDEGLGTRGEFQGARD